MLLTHVLYSKSSQVRRIIQRIGNGFRYCFCCCSRCPQNVRHSLQEIRLNDDNNNNEDKEVPTVVVQEVQADCYDNSNAESSEIVDVQPESYEPQDLLQQVLRFKNLELIGSGAFGQVFSAQQQAETGDKCQLIAIKTIQFESGRISGFKWSSYLKEVQMMRDLDHPNIVMFRSNFMVFEEDDGLLIVKNSIELELKPTLKLASIAMEHLGPDLLQYKHRFSWGQCFDERLLRAIFEQIGSAVVYLHGVHQMAHNDIKLDNVVFQHEPRDARPWTIPLKLVDFGNARIYTVQQLRSFSDRYEYESPFQRDAVALGTMLIQSAIPGGSITDTIPEMMAGLANTEQRTSIHDEQFRTILAQMTNQTKDHQLLIKEAMSNYWQSIDANSQ